MMRNLIRKAVATNAGLETLPLRLAVGTIFFREGTGKLFCWFGGSGPQALRDYFENLGIPFAALNAYMAGWTEFLGGTALIFGLLTRLASLGLAVTMTVAILTAHLSGGWAYPLALLASCITLLLTGGGRFSVDRKIAALK